MVRQEEIRGLNAHIRIHLIGLGVEELSGWNEVLPLVQNHVTMARHN